MKDYATVPNITGAFPNVVSKNTTGPGETDATPYIKQVIDDLWGARQDLMNEAGLTPDASDEATGSSQFLEALKILARKLSGDVVRNWKRIEDSALTADSFFGFAYAHTLSSLTKKMFVGVGQVNANSGVWQSQGGTKWVERVNPTASANMRGVCWDPVNALFIAVGDDSGGDANIITSPDGQTWTERANPKAFDLNAIACNPAGISVAVGDADGTDAYILRSTNGTTWTDERANPKNFALNSITWSAALGLFIAVGISDGSDTYIVTSSDGLAWAEKSGPDNLSYKGIAASPDIVVACSTSDNMMRSTNGSAWTGFAIADIPGEVIEVIVWDPYAKLFVAGIQNKVGIGGAGVAISPDGTNWDVAYLQMDIDLTDFGFFGMAVGNDRIVGGGISGGIAFTQNREG